MGRNIYGLLILAVIWQLASSANAQTYLLPAHVSQSIDSYNRNIGPITSFNYTDRTTLRVHECSIIKNRQYSCRSRPFSRGPDCPGPDCPNDLGVEPVQSLVINFRGGTKFYCSGEINTTDLSCRSESELRNCPGPGCPN